MNIVLISRREIREILEGIIGQASELVMDHCSKSYIRFAAPEWDRTSLKSGLGNLYAEWATLQVPYPLFQSASMTFQFERLYKCRPFLRHPSGDNH